MYAHNGSVLYPGGGDCLAALLALSKHGCMDRRVECCPEQNHTANTNCMHIIVINILDESGPD